MAHESFHRRAEDNLLTILRQEHPGNRCDPSTNLGEFFGSDREAYGRAMMRVIFRFEQDFLSADVDLSSMTVREAASFLCGELLERAAVYGGNPE
ncbi:MAG: hypothetical protein Greene041619_792 [Candidatus Peregrinibacteria bacterium Greene0416_19]|nr:MAG: hypothetical protein Greene041619_792 [Candidatus Peregrinibacteria bacterium Greene0416_19]